VSAWQLGSLALLGALHGINPAMGWLFAVLRGIQENARRAVLVALVLIAIGHLASVGITIGIVEGSQHFVSETVVRVAGASLLVGFAAWKLLAVRAHPRWVGLRIGAVELAFWSFLMSTAHGAGLMLLPITVTVAGAHATAASGLLWGGGAAVVHTLAMILVAGAVAVLVYDVIGLNVLRRAWINLDKVWALALLGAAVVMLLEP
jgi:hypothetical protein